MQAQANNVKERILFIQHMALSASDRSVRRAFEKFGRILKCEQLVPGKDMWMLQFSDRKVCFVKVRCVQDVTQCVTCGMLAAPCISRPRQMLRCAVLSTANAAALPQM
jgi:hypothetical protein